MGHVFTAHILRIALAVCTFFALSRQNTQTSRSSGISKTRCAATLHHTPRSEARGAHRCVECRFAIVRGAARPRCSRCQATQAACGPVTTSMRWHNAIQAPANGFVCHCLGKGRVIGRGLGEGGFLPRNPPRNLPSWPGRGVPRGVLAQNGVSKNTPKLGITDPGPNVPQSRCIAGVVFVFKVLGCRRNV